MKKKIITINAIISVLSCVVVLLLFRQNIKIDHFVIGFTYGIVLIICLTILTDILIKKRHRKADARTRKNT